MLSTVAGQSNQTKKNELRKPELECWSGTTPTIDGDIGEQEWKDAESLLGVIDWVATFSDVSSDEDLSLRGWVKHDQTHLYFAFAIRDNLLYGVETERWLPANNENAHELSRRGFPWFGDMMELDTYQSWILQRKQHASVKIDQDRKGYSIEWAVAFDPCLEWEPGKFYSPEMGKISIGLNIALGDLDHRSDGEGNFGNVHHEQWWAGAPNTRTQKNNFGTMHLMGIPRPTKF